MYRSYLVETRPKNGRRMFLIGVLVFTVMVVFGCRKSGKKDVDAGLDAGIDGALIDGEVIDGDLVDAEVDGEVDGEVPLMADCEGVAFEPCTPAEGNNGVTLLKGTVLTPENVICNGEVLISRVTQKIICVGEDCSGEPEAAQATVLCADIISPGLIDSHNHMTFNTIPPWRHDGVLYEHRDEWRTDSAFNAYDVRLSGDVPDRYSEFRLLMSGTTGVHKSSGRVSTFTGVRNLDRGPAGNRLGMPNSAITECVFPLAGHCHDKPDYDNLDPSLRSYIVHLSEGINQKSFDEFETFVNDGQLGNRTTIIHGVSLDSHQAEATASSGAAFIWSPQTNIDLYGVTAPVTAIWNMGIPVALAPDWTISGTLNLIAELKCADHLNTKYYDSFFSTRDLFSMVTSGAAAAMRIDDLVGWLYPGHFADVIAVSGDREFPYDTVIDMQSADVRAVFIGGEAYYGDVDALNSDIEYNSFCETIDVCSTPKRICIKEEAGEPSRPLNRTQWALWSYDDYIEYLQGELDELMDQNNPPPEHEYLYTLLPLFKCEAFHWCDMGNAYVPGTPTAEDADGDGIPDHLDNCPYVFNPDQGDLDGDGVGDACDPCPYQADPEDCPKPDPRDRTGDGVPNYRDNCPFHYNPDQEDTSGDGIGDVCHPCPSHFLPDGGACPATVYEVKTGVYLPGDPVLILDVLVTGLASNRGFFVQTPVDHVDFAGEDWSGIYIYTGSSPSVSVGDRVNVEGVVHDFYDQIQIAGNPLVTVVSQNNPAPEPIMATPEEIAAGGSRADALEGVVCEIHNVTVTDLQLTFNEWEVDDVLWINDFLYLTDPFPSVGEQFSIVRGILQWTWSDSKLNPRSAEDVIPGG